MSELVYITLGSRSLKENAEVYPFPPGNQTQLRNLMDKLKENWSDDSDDCPAWTGVDGQLNGLWKIGGDRPQPFSELRPFAGMSPNPAYEKVRLLALCGEDEFKVYSVLDSDGFHKYATQLLLKNEYLNDRNLTDNSFEVEIRPLPAQSSNEAKDFYELRAAVFDECAAIAEELEKSGFEGEVLVNGVGGANAGVEALVWAAAVLGWKVAYSSLTSIVPAKPAISPATAGASWAHAMTLVSSNRTRLAQELSIDRPGGANFDAKGIAQGYLKQAHDSHALPYVRMGRTAGGHPCLVMSRMAAKLVEIGNCPAPYYSATTAMLLRSDRDGAKAYGQTLQELVQHWACSDLFGGNLVHELVLHGVSHCEAVDRNVASLCEPLLRDKLIDPIDVFDLGVSAWLHDWGHSGIPLEKPDELGNLLLPGELRAAHGVISASRIAANERTANVPIANQACVRTICSHHQGWASVTSLRPAKPPVSEILGTFSLFSDWYGFLREAHTEPNLPTKPDLDVPVGEIPEALDAENRNAYGRLQLLVALFRVADAADLGLHRVPVSDVRAQQERCLDEAKLGILAHFRGPNGQLTADSAKRAQAFVKYARRRLRLFQDDLNKDDKQIVDKTSVVKEVVDHCADQMQYFRKHNLVRGAYLTMTVNGDGYTVTAHVTPNPDAPDAPDQTDDGLRNRRALVAVQEDIQRELGLSPRLGDSDVKDATLLDLQQLERLEWRPTLDKPQKWDVGQILQKRGISFGPPEEA